MHGFGVCRFANRHWYEGAWREGIRQGLGMYTFRNGETQSGHRQNGLLDIPSAQNTTHLISSIAIYHYKVLNVVQCAIPAHVINAAKEKLSNAFGYELRELLRYRPSSATQRHSTQQTDVAKAKSYVLISQLPAEVYKKYVEDENSARLSSFTFVVISIVHLARGNTLFYVLAERALDRPVSEKMKEYISEIDSKEVVPVDVDEAE
ncbi:MAGE domain-containing protein [Citrus sinensis]|nr:MAGE domain-containing protein [Citrus sinensis]